MKQILHDWNDEQALHILRNCREAVRAGGKVLHIGAVLRPPNEPDFARLIDLAILTMQTGRERTEAEFRTLFTAARFSVSRVIRIGGGLAIVEGVAV